MTSMLAFILEGAITNVVNGLLLAAQLLLVSALAPADQQLISTTT